MEFWVAGNVGIRQMSFENAGKSINGHAHNFSHVTYVTRGTLKIERLESEDGPVARTVIKRASDGYNWVLIEAGVYHRITALEDNSVGHCIYAHRNPQSEVVEEYDGWGPAYE